MHGVLSSGEPSTEDLVARKQHLEFIKEGFDEFAKTLKSKELTIFERRMVSEDKATLQELSDELAISRERVRQIENRIKEKLQQFFLSKVQDRKDELGF